MEAILCRTDLKIIRHGHRDPTLPRVPGEEVVGEVVPLGGDSPIAVGDRVYVYPGVWCGVCPSCCRGAENLCRKMRIMGFHRDGGFAEYVAAPLQSLIPVPDGLSDEQAVFPEPLSCSLNALELGGVGEGDVLGIWGAGPAGTLLSRAGALRGAAVLYVAGAATDLGDGRARGARQARGVGGGAGRRARAAHGGRSPPGGTARRGRPGRLTRAPHGAPTNASLTATRDRRR